MSDFSRSPADVLKLQQRRSNWCGTLDDARFKCWPIKGARTRMFLLVIYCFEFDSCVLFSCHVSCLVLKLMCATERAFMPKRSQIVRILLPLISFFDLESYTAEYICMILPSKKYTCTVNKRKEVLLQYL